MFITVNDTKELTGYDVDETLLIKAQTIIEAYVGRVEVEVTNAQDLMLLGRATAFQAVFMKDDEARVYEQMGATQVMQAGSMVTFAPGAADPFVAPLAQIACRRLSWKRIRSVKTASIFDQGINNEGTWRTL